MRRNRIILSIILLLSFITGILIGHLTRHTLTEDRRFENYTSALFKSQVQGNTINLHYTLANPKEYGIKNYPITLGSISTSSEDLLASIKNELTTLTSFSYKELNQENQLTYDILSLSLKQDQGILDHYLLTDVLSPTLGIQAQLPILLAEYSFRNQTDIDDYLELIRLTETYFQQILDFEKAKSKAGFFMSDTTADRIIVQCRDFIENPDENFLLSTFSDKLNSCDFLSDKKKEKYIQTHEKLVKQKILPAYQQLIQGLDQLKGTGKNPYGLSYYTDGAEFYSSLVKSTVGISDEIPALELRLQKQLASDFKRMQRLLKVHPQVASNNSPQIDSSLFPTDPFAILSDLQKEMSYDFPTLESPDYKIKYVNSALAEHLSPAFYLIPPFDALTPNSIYLNPASNLTDMDLFTTLAHEGFPGHLYQNKYFTSTNPNPLRHLLGIGGYIEGWATYVEGYACQYAPLDRDMGEIIWLNRSINLCLYSLLDIGIHYRGWTPEQAGEFLSIFGITSQEMIAEIYQCIIEDPGNYLQYYVGCLNFIDLRSDLEEKLGKNFVLQNFHKKVLDIGPSQFPVLKKWLYKVYDI